MNDGTPLVRRYIERIWNAGDLAALDTLTSEEFRYHLNGQPPLDRVGMRSFVAMIRVAFPDWRVETDEIVARGDAVAVRWHAEATHEGPFRGIPRTGRRLSVSGINMYRVTAGRIDAEWEQMDSFGMLQQLGVLPKS
jgi:steroid delta-isomerase-like uncharacterized protein